MKKLVFPALFLTTVLSCSVKPELRKDIAEFISHFSLQGALDEYKTGGYVSTTLEVEEEKTSKEVIEMDFSLTDVQHPTYVETTTNYVNNEITSVNEVKVVEDESGFYLSTNGELKPTTIDEIGELIIQFFYKQVDLDGSYHTQGFYYGDYLKEIAPMVQDLVTIDQTNELYLYSYSATVKDDQMVATMSQSYTVNKWGMMEENHILITADQNSVQQDIIVHK